MHASRDLLSPTETPGKRGWALRLSLEGLVTGLVIFHVFDQRKSLRNQLTKQISADLLPEFRSLAGTGSHGNLSFD